MTESAFPARLDVPAFVRNGAARSGRAWLYDFSRLAASVWPGAEDAPIDWRLDAQERATADGVSRPALHLGARATLALACQRCLERVDVPVRVDRYFVFVAEERVAAALDTESEDDILALETELDLAHLLEDELILALPMIPRHEHCPVAPRMSAQTADFDAADTPAAHPFAALAQLKRH